MSDETQNIPEIAEDDWEDVGQGLDPSEEDLQASEGLDLNNMAPASIGGIYELFSTIIKSPDVIRTCNLSKEERGSLPFTVVGSLYVSQLAEQFGHKIFAAFFINQAEIVMETSLSKDGFLPNLIVTSRKYATATSEQNKSFNPESIKPKKKGWKIFSK